MEIIKQYHGLRLVRCVGRYEVQEQYAYYDRDEWTGRVIRRKSWSLSAWSHSIDRAAEIYEAHRRKMK